MLRKGALESGLGEIILTVLTASVIAGVMFGPLGAKMGEGFEEAQDFTNVADEVVIDNSDEFGELAHYVFWRAWNCDELESWTFQTDKLKDTGYVEDNGQGLCAGASSTISRGFKEIITGESGQDMEGKYGRVEFEINESFTLDTGRGFGVGGGTDYGDSAVLLGVATGYSEVYGVNVNNEYGKQEYSTWIAGGCTRYLDADDMRDHAQDPSDDGEGPPYSAYTFFFENGPSDDRVTRINNGETFDDRYHDLKSRVLGSEYLYCSRTATTTPALAAPLKRHGFDRAISGEHTSPHSYGHVEVQLCKGDKGYIETRKKKPTISGEAGNNLAIGQINNDNLYGVIQITDKGPDCT